METFELTRKFQQREAADAVKLKEQRAAILELNSELRKAYNLSSAAAIEGVQLSALEEAEIALQSERHEAVLKILELALADVNHHLSLIQLYNKTAEFDAKAYL